MMMVITMIPIREAFLVFLDKDMLAHPEQVVSLAPTILRRAQTLVQRIEVDLDAPLEDDEP